MTSATVWDLSHVLPATEGPAFEAVLRELESKVKLIEAERPRLDAYRSGADVERVLALYTDVSTLAHRLDSWGSLSFSVDTTDAAVKAYMAKMDALTTDVSNRVRFFELWWKTLADDRAAALKPRGNPDVEHLLDRMRVFRPHTLSEAEERVVAFKDVTGGTALERLREIMTSKFRFKDPKSGKTITQSELIRYVYDPSATVREAAYRELWRIYSDHEAELSFLYQTVVQDWQNEKLKLRNYASPINARNKANDVTDAAVATLLDVCRENRHVFQRYFTWKGRKLGLEPMSRFHVYAPLREEKIEVPYEQARDKVVAVFDRFSPDVGREARKVFDEKHVHAYPAPAKRGGAYCATVTSTLTPYVFLNYTGDASSVKTLAHEMGHAIHSLLARDRHPLVAHSSLPMAETASVFAEMLLHRELMDDATPAQRASILSEKIGEMYATVMRQAYFVRFEIMAHEKIPEGATADDLNAWYLKDLREQFGPVEVPEDFRREWTYIPHLFASPFYCYAYSFGMLLSLALYGRYLKEGPSFVPKYTQILASGGSASASTILARVGIDVADRAFWQGGFHVIEEMVRELEKTGA